MFELFLKKRPTEIGLNYDELAKATSMEHWGKANPVRTGFFDWTFLLKIPAFGNTPNDNTFSYYNKNVFSRKGNHKSVLQYYRVANIVLSLRFTLSNQLLIASYMLHQRQGVLTIDESKIHNVH